MPANFKNNTAVMTGIDIHKAVFIALGEHLWIYNVTSPYSSSDGDDSKRTSTVTADGSKMIREGFTISNVPHVPMMGPLHPFKQSAKSAAVVKASFTRPFLTIMSVTSQGDPLAICLKGSAGSNVDCNFEDIPIPTGKAICVCSVRTQPTGKDLIFRFFDEIVKRWIPVLIDKLIDAAAKALKPKWVPGIVWKIPVAIVKWIAKKAVPKLIDRAEEAAKRQLDKADRAKQGAPVP